MWQSEHRKGQSYVKFFFNTFQVCENWQLESDHSPNLKGAGKED